MILRCRCGVKIRTTPEMQGRKVGCPKCKSSMVVPMQGPAPSPAQID